MRVIDADAIGRALSFPILIEALADAFRGGIVAPPRHHHTIPRSGPDGTLLLMPAWTEAEAEDGYVGVKLVSVFPGNAERGLATVQGTYVLTDARGTALAALDGTRLTLWRTAAASALAARSLARSDAARLVLVGTGALAPFLARAHASVRTLADIRVWGRSPERVEATAAALRRDGLPASRAADLQQAVSEADIVSCATLATEPVVRGAWLRPGVHLDLVGAFTPRMRETDDEALRRAELYVDTAAALTEGGDVTIALASGAIEAAHIRGNLADLCTGRVPGRTNPAAITAFKSIGASLEDLAAAICVHRAVR